MHARVVEVVARIADSVVDLAHVGIRGRYRIGTAPEVELPVAAGALRAFPVLDLGFVFRRPAGLPAILHAEGTSLPITDAELRLRPGWRIEIPLGRVTLSLALVERPRIAVPRRRAELRPFVYGAAVLVVHLVVWAAAMLVEPIERLAIEVEAAPRPPHVRVAHVEEPPPPPPPSKQAAATGGGGASAPEPDGGQRGPRDPKARAIASARQGGMMAALGDLSALIPKVDVRKLVNDSVFYDEEAATRGNFGNSRRFDPTKNCTDCGTVKTGRYATVSKGRGAGEDYRLPGEVAHPQPLISPCEPSDCRVTGASSLAIVRHDVDLRLGAFGYCYQRFARKQLKGLIVLDFAIAPDGHVHSARARGLDEIRDCIVDVLNVIPFPLAEAGTTVKYPLSFQPSS